MIPTDYQAKQAIELLKDWCKAHNRTVSIEGDRVQLDSTEKRLSKTRAILEK